METQKNKGGRPPKAPTEKLTRQLNISLTESTFKALITKACDQKQKHQDIARKAIESVLHS
jgi:hypothetical protein